METSTRRYVGRAFQHGVTDCYSLIRDWYAEERGFFLPDFDREDAWWEKGGNLYLDNYALAGFAISAQPPAPGDVLLMRVLSLVPNHAAIYVGNNRILHHLYGRLSACEIYGSFYQRRTTQVLRHENCNPQR